MAKADETLREQLVRQLGAGEAHIGIVGALDGLPMGVIGRYFPGVPHSLWSLLYHVQRVQRDILDFIQDPDYIEPSYPSGYWPPSGSPASEKQWRKIVASFSSDLLEARRLAADPQIDLLGPLPFGRGHSYLRQFLLIIQHNSYHIGQIVQLRSLLGVPAED